MPKPPLPSSLSQLYDEDFVCWVETTVYQDALTEAIAAYPDSDFPAAYPFSTEL